jgi:hypothetical protein
MATTTKSTRSKSGATKSRSAKSRSTTSRTAGAPRRSRTSKTTIDHDEIRAWVEQRQGRPARVKGTGDGKDPGLLRIDFPGYSGEHSLEAITWDQFFEGFEKNQLAFVYQDRKKSGEPSTFAKLVQRESEPVGA